MKQLLQTLLPGALIAVLLFGGCVKQPETIVVNEEPEAPTASAAADEDSTAVPPEAAANFRQLVIGEIHRIPTLDPLFADNNSTRRTLQILYEGLVRYNQTGNVVPAISKRWSVSDDSLTYRFTLRDDVYFHDSEIFSNGIGRKVVASDFSYALTRMAKLNVPGDAAQLFMSVEGFEPYFKEQHNVLNPSYRELNGVSGFGTPNDSTLVIRLNEKDRHLLQKLASPYAVVYPREAVRGAPADFAPVGSGPFQLSQKRGDSTFIFSKYKEFWNAGNGVPVIDRVDVSVRSDEVRLFRDLAEGQVHMLPEMGPRILDNVMLSAGELQQAYRENYRLILPGGRTTYSLKLNPEADQSKSAIRSLFSSLDDSLLFAGIPSELITGRYIVATESDASAAVPSLPLLSTYSPDPFQQRLIARISTQLEGDRPLRMLRIRTPSRRTAIETRSFVPMYEGHRVGPGDDTLLQYSVHQGALAIWEISNLQFNGYPWWINLRAVNLPGIDQL
ncbi:MAG: ABC transporter substrate-binding protein [Balneolaceae bacterium]|nr:ABC transporter substrate-binding protein [Balneolaceae bacterium]